MFPTFSAQAISIAHFIQEHNGLCSTRDIRLAVLRLAFATASTLQIVNTRAQELDKARKIECSNPLSWISGKFVGINYALLPNRQWNKKQKHKKQPWSNVECFAFGGATVRFASLETSFHAANHTIPPPPSYEGYPHCPKDKNRSPFHGEKPLIVK